MKSKEDRDVFNMDKIIKSFKENKIKFFRRICIYVVFTCFIINLGLMIVFKYPPIDFIRTLQLMGLVMFFVLYFVERNPKYTFPVFVFVVIVLLVQVVAFTFNLNEFKGFRTTSDFSVKMFLANLVIPAALTYIIYVIYKKYQSNLKGKD